MYKILIPALLLISTNFCFAAKPSHPVKAKKPIHSKNNNNAAVEQDDSIPDIQKATVNFFNSLYANYLLEKDDKAKADFIEASKPKITEFINKKIKFEVKDWEAKVLMAEQQEHAVQDVELGIELHSKKGAKPVFNSLVFRAFVSTSDIAMVNQMRDIKQNDIVIFSGLVDVFKDYPSFDSYTESKDGILSNPVIYIKLSEIIRISP